MGVSSRLRLVPRPGLVPYRLVSSDEWQASKTWREVLGFASSFYHIIHAAGVPSPSRSSSRSLVSSGVSHRAVGASRASHQTKGKQARRRGGAFSGSRLVIPSRHPCGRACRSRVIVPSSPHPIITGKQAGRRRQDGLVAWASVSFSRSAWAVMIPGAGVVPHHPQRRSPHPCPIPTPKRKTRQASRQA